MELYHHGVKGQQWGVRNGPPYPIEDKVLKKGTRINSVSGTYSDSEKYRKRFGNQWMYTYRDDEEWDNKVYKGAFSKYLVMSRGANFIAEHKYETVKDLKMPNKNERMSEFKGILNDKKFRKQAIKDIEHVRTQLVYYNVGSPKELESYKKFKPNNIKTAEDYRVAYEIFNHAMEAVHMYPTTREYAKRMSKKYDAMVDDNNQGIYNDAHDPIIIFRTKEALKTVGKNYLTAKEIVDNYAQVSAELAKQGRAVKL